MGFALVRKNGRRPFLSLTTALFGVPRGAVFCFCRFISHAISTGISPKSRFPLFVRTNSPLCCTGLSSMSKVVYLNSLEYSIFPCVTPSNQIKLPYCSLFIGRSLPEFCKSVRNIYNNLLDEPPCALPAEEVCAAARFL